MSALAEALVAAQGELPCALGKDATGQIGNRDDQAFLYSILARVDPDLYTGCWKWTGALARDGYGQLRRGGTRPQRVHRAVYEFLVGPIPAGLHLDHLCRVRHCVNPEHLEPVTPRENTLRGAALITHCPHGHKYDDANTRRRGGAREGQRVCRACARTDALERYYRTGKEQRRVRQAVSKD